MGELEIGPFEVQHLAEAANLLAGMHATHFSRQPHLHPAPRFDELIEKEREHGRGFVAQRDGAVVAYMIGVPGDGAFGPHLMYQAHGVAWSDASAVAPLFGAVSETCVASGQTEQYVYVADLAECIAPWFDLDFGTSAFQAALDIQTYSLPALNHSIRVRPGTSEDLHEAATMNRLMDLHIQRPPSFGTAPVGSLDEYEDDWATTWDDEQFHHLIAEAEGRAVGQVLLYRRPSDNLRVPPGSLDLAQAYVEPKWRRSGVMAALLDASVQVLAREGGDVLITDWRAGNFPAMTVWPTYGFVPTYRRLHRSIRSI